MKKTLLYIIGAIVVVAALTVSLIFVFGGKNENEQVNVPDLTGNWVVAAVYTNDTPVFTENQYMVFKDGTASMYTDGKSEPYATSTYSINEASQLLLPDISREYKVAKKTDHCVRLYESADKYLLLVKNSSEALVPEAVTVQDLTGSWNVAMKGDQLNNGEKLSFADGKLSYYKAGATEPSATADFTLENGVLKAPTLGMEMRCYATSENTLALIEQSGIVWELAK